MTQINLPIQLPVRKRGLLNRGDFAFAGVLLLLLSGLIFLGYWMYSASTGLGIDDWAAPYSSSVDQKTENSIVEPETFRFQDVGADKAVLLNAAVPASTDPVVAALPFAAQLNSSNIASRLTAVDCLTSAIYYEAASENIIGQRAVAQVVLNRVRHAAYPKSVCGVVFQGSERSTGCQFSFTCDGSMARRPSAASWTRARGVASAALSGSVESSVGLATHYHTVWVVPYWSSSLSKIGTLGSHIFYRWRGSNGTRNAFNGRYSNVEIQPSSLAARLGNYLLVKNGASSDPSLLAEAIPFNEGIPDNAGNVAQNANSKLPTLPPSPLPAKSKMMVDDKESALLHDQVRGELLVK